MKANYIGYLNYKHTLPSFDFQKFYFCMYLNLSAELKGNKYVSKAP